MSKPRSHLLDVYDCWLHVATTRKQWAKLARRYHLTNDLDAGGHVTLFVDSGDHNQPHVAVWLNPRDMDDPRRRVDTIAHEATHVAAQMLDHIGQHADRHDNETLAYLVGWVSGWLWMACNDAN